MALWTTLLVVLIREASSYLVCYAYFGVVQDLGWTYHHNLARAKTDEVLGSDSKYVEGVGFKDAAGQEEVLEQFVSDGCQLIVTGSGAFTYLTIAMAEKHPSVKWYNLGGEAKSSLQNMGGSVIKVYQACYIAGIIAGMDPNIKKLGYIGSTYMADSLLCVNAFFLGARLKNPTIPMSLIHVGNWYMPREERIAALRLFNLHGADVLDYDSDSVTTVEVAKAQTKLSFGMKSDGAALYGDSNLASQILVWDTIFTDIVAAAMDTANPSSWLTARNANRFVGFDKFALSMGTYSSKVTPAQRSEAISMIRRFASGDDPVFCKPGGFQTFCPSGANEESSSFGGTPPAIIFPCDQTAASKDCLNDDDKLSLHWLVDGIHDLGLLKAPQCPKGTYTDPLASTLCVACPRGRFTDQVDQSECELCKSGHYNSQTGAESCKPCKAGEFANGAGMYSCSDCRPGTFSTGLAAECTECPPGTHRSVPGAKGMFECKLCPIGTYAEVSGMQDCKACGEGLTTETPGIATQTDCVCGEYTIFSNGECQKCGEGLTCPAGSAVSSTNASAGVLVKASLEEGYWSSAIAPQDVLRCMPESVCPGGPVETCDGGLVGVVCGECADSQFFDGSTCHDCGVVGPASWICSFALIAVALICSYYLLNSRLTAKASIMMCTACSMGMLLSMLQNIGVVSMVSVPYPGSLGAIWNFLTIFTLNLDSLGFACVAGGPRTRYVASALMFPSMVVFLPIIGLITRILPVPLGYKWRKGPTINVAGQVMQVAFTTMSAVAFAPFMCYQHPNGKTSVLKYPAVFCWENDHAPIATTGGLLTFVGFTYLMMCFYCAYKAPAWATDVRIISRIRFLIHRFRPDVWWFGAVLLCRGPLVALPMAMFGNSPHLQLLLIMFVISFFVLLQVLYWPWKLPLLNLLDAFMGFVVCLLIGINMSFLEAVEGDVRTGFMILSYLGLLSLAGCLLGMVGICIGALFSRGAMGGVDELMIFNLGKPIAPPKLAETFCALIQSLSMLDETALVKDMRQLSTFDLRRIVGCITLLGNEFGIYSDPKFKLSKRLSFRRSTDSVRCSVGSTAPALSEATEDTDPSNQKTPKEMAIEDDGHKADEACV